MVKDSSYDGIRRLSSLYRRIRGVMMKRLVTVYYYILICIIYVYLSVRHY